MVDVTIRGAGAFGLACGWEMARRGVRVRVIDPGGVAAGASGGVVGALAPHTPERWNAKKAFQLRALLAAEAFWAEVETVSGLGSGYGRVGRLQAVDSDRALDLARERAGEAEKLWQGKATWKVIRTDDAGAWAPVCATGWLIHDTLSARLHPARACAALAAAIQERGGSIVRDGPEDGWVLHATGAAGLSALSQALGQEVGNAVKGQAALLDLDRRGQPQLYVDGLHIVPHDDGTTAIGSTSERDFTDADSTDAQLEALIARARRLCTDLEDAEVLRRWAGLRPRARSRAPMLGQWPGRAGHFIANGGFKIGFGMVPEVARVMADLVLEGRPDGIPPDFDVSASLRP